MRGDGRQTFWVGLGLAWAGLGTMLVAAGCGDDVGGGDGSGGAGGTTGAGLIGSGLSGSGAAGNPPPIDPGCDGDADVHAGEATYYDFADGSGNCSFPATPNDLMVGAINNTDYAGSAACGACAAIDGPDGSIVVRIVDRCPECPAGDIDLSPEAFEQIAPLSDGRVDISWRYTSCPVTGPVAYHFKDGSNPFWVAVQVRNHTNAIATFEARDESGSYVELQRAEYNYFINEAGLGEGPFDFRITDVAGHVVENMGIPLMDDGEAPGVGQFAACMPAP